MQLTGLQGKVAIVTGAAQGIGAGIACALATEGMTLALVDRDSERLQALCAKLTANGVAALPLPADLGEPNQCQAVIARTIETYGRLDVLVNNAGLLRAAPVLELSLEDFELTFAVNTRAVFVCSQAAARQMLVQGQGGAIITIASDMAHIPRPLQSAYCASKAATTHMMRCFGLELAAHGIRCNSVLPGATDTEMVQQIRAAIPAGGVDEILHGSLEKFRNAIPLGRLATVEQIGTAVVFLLSDQAGHITMHDLVVDGGGTLGV